MTRILWEEMKRQDIAKARDQDAVVLIPAGSIEQHGTHMPVGTDSLRAHAIAVRAAELIDEFPVLVTPTISYGISPHHMVFPGTITLSVGTYCRVVQEICRCIWQHGFRHILILSGHGGNNGALESAILQLAAENILVAWGPCSQATQMEYQQILKGEVKRMIHADEAETSEMLFLYPELIDMSLAVRDLNLAMPRDCNRNPDTRFSIAWISSPDDSGLYGDSTLACAETGKKLIEMRSAKIARFIRDFKAAPVPDNWKRARH